MQCSSVRSKARKSLSIVSALSLAEQLRNECITRSNQRLEENVRQDVQREFRKTTTSLNKRFNEQNSTLHVRYNSSYISFPSSAPQQCEMTKFCARCVENVNDEGHSLNVFLRFSLCSIFSFETLGCREIHR